MSSNLVLSTVKRQRDVYSKRCPACGAAFIGYQYRCISCRNIRRTNNNPTRGRWKAEGKCHDCGQDNSTGKSRCEQCSEKSRMMGRKRSWANKLQACQKVSCKDIPDCICCGLIDLRLLTINHKSKSDHISSGHLYILINSGRRITSDLEVRCFNCQILFEYEKGRLSLPNPKFLVNMIGVENK